MLSNASTTWAANYSECTYYQSDQLVESKFIETGILVSVLVALATLVSLAAQVMVLCCVCLVACFAACSVVTPLALLLCPQMYMCMRACCPARHTGRLHKTVAKLDMKVQIKPIAPPPGTVHNHALLLC